MIFYSCVLVSIAGLFNAAMDTLQFHYGDSVFSSKRLKADFWNPEISWRNKWKMGMPGMGAKFFGSTTFFVMFTNGWHLMKSGMLFSIIGACVVYSGGFGSGLASNVHNYLLIENATWIGGIVDYVILSVLFRLSFSLFYWAFRW